MHYFAYMEFGYQEIAPGEAGIDQTVDIMAQHVAAALRRPTIRLKAVEIVTAAGASSKTPTNAAQAIYSWVKNNIRYVHDPVNVETIQDPDVTLQLKAGDCDDQAALVSALMNAIGIETRYRVIGAGDMLHIYPEIFVNNQWIGVDTTITGQFGTKPHGTYQKFYNSAGRTIPTERRESMRTQALHASLGIAPVVAAAATAAGKIPIVSNLFSSLFGPSAAYKEGLAKAEYFWDTFHRMEMVAAQLSEPLKSKFIAAYTAIQPEWQRRGNTGEGGGSDSALAWVQTQLVSLSQVIGVDLTGLWTNVPHNPLPADLITKLRNPGSTNGTGATAALASMFGGSNLLPVLLIGGVVAFAIFGSKPAPATRRRRKK